MSEATDRSPDDETIPAATALATAGGAAPEADPAPTGRDPWATRLTRRLATGPIYAVLIVVALVWITPTLGLFVSSLRSPRDNAGSGWWTTLGSPGELSLDNYRSLLENDRITGSFWNTVSISVPATLLVVIISALAAYVFAFVRFRGRDGLFLIVVGLLVVPIQVALIPIAQLYGKIGIFGQTSGVVLFHVAFGLPLGIFLLRNFFNGIPVELLEAARMDGASEIRLFFQVVLPLGLPAIASLAIFQFLWVWNDLLVALIFADSDSAPLTVAIREQTRQFGSNIDVIAPGAFLSMLVPLIVFFAFQRYFVQGLLAGSSK